MQKLCNVLEAIFECVQLVVLIIILVGAAALMIIAPVAMVLH